MAFSARRASLPEANCSGAMTGWSRRWDWQSALQVELVGALQEGAVTLGYEVHRLRLSIGDADDRLFEVAVAARVEAPVAAADTDVETIPDLIAEQRFEL